MATATNVVTANRTVNIGTRKGILVKMRYYVKTTTGHDRETGEDWIDYFYGVSLAQNYTYTDHRGRTFNMTPYTGSSNWSGSTIGGYHVAVNMNCSDNTTGPWYIVRVSDGATILSTDKTHNSAIRAKNYSMPSNVHQLATAGTTFDAYLWTN